MKLFPSKCHEWATLGKLQYDVKWEIGHYYPQNVDGCCTWPDVVAGISAHFSKFAFVLFCYITNHLMTGPLGNSEFCFLQISMFPSTSPQGTLRFSGNKIYCSPRDQSVSVNSNNSNNCIYDVSSAFFSCFTTCIIIKVIPGHKKKT